MKTKSATVSWLRIQAPGRGGFDRSHGIGQSVDGQGEGQAKAHTAAKMRKAQLENDLATQALAFCEKAENPITKPNFECILSKTGQEMRTCQTAC